MNLRKLTAGEPLSISASDWNAAMDATRDFLNRRNIGQPQGDADTDSGMVLVKNASGADVDRFGILGIDSILFTPTDNLNGFKNQACLTGVAPTVADHTGKFVIAAEGIPAGKIGRCYLQAVCPVQVETVASDFPPFADVKASSLTQLIANTVGAAQILYRESGTGVKWAIVRVGSSRRTNMIPVQVTKDGGADGSATTQATWTYTAKTLQAVTLGTGLTPKLPARPAIGKVTFAPNDSYGTGVFKDDGTFILMEVAEVALVEAC